MISFWRNRRRATPSNNPSDSRKTTELTELIIPKHFLCPISQDLMKDPVTLSTGITYDRDSIDTWLDAGNTTCPVTNRFLTNSDVLPNHAIRKIIQDWCVQNQSRGIDRIPTPKIPITSHQVLEILSDIHSAAQQNDATKCVESVRKIKASAKESDRNRRCISGLSTGRVLAEAFDSFARKDGQEFVNHNGELFEEILLAFPRLDVETSQILSTTLALEKIVSVMMFGSLSAQRNAVIALNSILSSDQSKVTIELVNIDGSLEAVVKLIKEPICPATTKASLLALYHMLTPSELPHLTKEITTCLVEMELIQMLMEILVDSERSVCEKVLGVLDGLCSHEDGRRMACGNALTVPVLVKKLLRVSDLATELSISVLVKLGKHDYDGTGCVIEEALQAGAFQKLLLVLQIGTSDRTRDKVTELLKMLNLYRSGIECTDSLDMKNLKRPF